MPIRRKKKTSIGKTLAQVLEETKGMHIKVCCGTSFIYCKLNDHTTEAEIMSNGIDIYGDYLKKIDEQQKRIDDLKKIGKVKYAKDALQRQEERIAICTENGLKYKKVVRDLDGFKEEYDNKLYSYKQQKSKYMRKIREWEPILERDVVEIFPSTVRDDTIIIVCTGDILGGYWDEDEYLNGVDEDDVGNKEREET